MQKNEIYESAADYYAKLLNRVELQKKDLILPIFACEESEQTLEGNAMPGIGKIHPNHLSKHIQNIIDLGISSVIIFGIPKKRDRKGSSAVHKYGIVRRTVRKIKREFGSMLNVITDVCICQYNLSGHCGLEINGRHKCCNKNIIDNDRTIALLSKIAVSHAESGADIIAPSSMMDGQVYQIRSSLDRQGFRETKIMSYSAKHASSLYLPFRMTAFSKGITSYTSIDKSSYQIGYTNPRELVREIEADIKEGADMIMIKPGLAYLDTVSMVKDIFDFPTVVQNVSGEYAMIKAAARNGWIDEEEWKVNSIAAMKRAGADNIISYFSMDIVKYLDG